MTDDELRALARAVVASGGPAERIAYARALERAGRGDDALAALVAGRADAVCRRELARFPAWTREAADEGRTRFLDVAPVRRAPRVAWRTPSPGGPLRALLASPLAVVAIGLDEVLVLDPPTGAVRHVFPRASGVALAGERLVAVEREDDVVLRDLHDGRVLARAARGAVASPALAFVTKTSRTLGVSQLLCVSDPELEPFLAGSRQDLVLERGIRADARGSVALGSSGLEARAVTGERVVARDAIDAVLALAPGFVVAEPRAPDQRARASLVALDRETGAATELAVLAPNGVVAVARDVIAAVRDDELAAVTARGEILWRFSPGGGAGSAAWSILSVVPQPRRLYVLARDVVVALDEPA